VYNHLPPLLVSRISPPPPLDEKKNKKSGSLRNDVLYNAHLHIWYFCFHFVFKSNFSLFYPWFGFIAPERIRKRQYIVIDTHARCSKRPLNTRSDSWDPPFLFRGASIITFLLRHDGFVCRAYQSNQTSSLRKLFFFLTKNQKGHPASRENAGRWRLAQARPAALRTRVLVHVSSEVKKKKELERERSDGPSIGRPQSPLVRRPVVTWKFFCPAETYTISINIFVCVVFKSTPPPFRLCVVCQWVCQPSIRKILNLRWVGNFVYLK
jgi:hypothetical protein